MDLKFICTNCDLEVTVHFKEIDFKHSQMYCNRCKKLTMYLVSK